MLGFASVALMTNFVFFSRFSRFFTTMELASNPLLLGRPLEDLGMHVELGKRTSKSRASRLAEVSNYKKQRAFGSQKQVLPIGAAAQPHTASQLF